MTGISVRKIVRILKGCLPVLAVEHDRPMKEEARRTSCRAKGKPAIPDNLGETIHRQFAAPGGAETDLPPGEPVSEPPNLG